MYEVWDAQDLAGVLELLDPEFEWVNPSTPSIPASGAATAAWSR
jgi:ketosteroid isomerase-like protein